MPKESRLNDISALLKKPSNNGSHVNDVFTEAGVLRQSIAIDLIVPRPKNRKSRNPQKFQALCDSIREIGITEDLILRPHPSQPGKYELISGHWRRDAAESLGLKTVPVRIVEADDKLAAKLAAAANLRESPNPLEEADQILEVLAVELEMPEEDVIKLLYRQRNVGFGNLKESKDNVILKSQWQTIELTFKAVSDLTPESFIRYRLSLLNYPAALLEAIRSGQLEYTKAELIRSLEEDRQQQLLREILEEGLSVREIRSRVRELKSKSRPSSSLKNSFRELYGRMGKEKVWDDPKRQKELTQIMKRLEKLLGEQTEGES